MKTISDSKWGAFNITRPKYIKLTETGKKVAEALGIK